MENMKASINQFLLILLAIFLLMLSASADVSRLISPQLFDRMLPHRNNPKCEGKNNFYSYEAFITAANSFPGFGTTGDETIQKRELAAFFGQTSHETSGGWPQAPGGPYAWGYCFIRQRRESRGAEGRYFGRGPIQLTGQDNYQRAGDGIKEDLVGKPYLVATNPVISFKTAIWYWMNRHYNKPSSHDVITGQWRPNDADRAANRFPGYGVITNIINGGLECGNGPNVASGDQRVAFYQRYCDIFRVTQGENLSCRNQRNFGEI